LWGTHAIHGKQAPFYGERKIKSMDFTATRTLEEVRDKVHLDDSGKWDTIVKARSVVLSNGRVIFPEATADGYDMGLSLTPWATGQACTKLGIPAAYFRKCPQELQDSNWNHWASRIGDVGYLTKSDQEAEEFWTVRAKGSTVRGVLSQKYTKLDNSKVMEAVMPLVTGSEFKVGLSEITSESFHLRLIRPDLSRDAFPKDKLMVAVHIANSEVGYRAVSVDAGVFRLVCANGLMRRVDGKSHLKQRHIHVDDGKFPDLLRGALQEAVTSAAGFMEQMVQSTRMKIPCPENALELIAEEWTLPKQTLEYARFALHGESGADTLYGLVNAFTNASQKLSVDERLDLETRAGTLVDLGTPNRLRERILTFVNPSVLRN
jgi:Domain of unknown function (DUF932)